MTNLPTHEIRIYLRKWNMRLGYIMLEDLDIHKLSILIQRGYTIEPVSILV